MLQIPCFKSRLKIAVTVFGWMTLLAASGGRAEAADPVTRGDAYGEQISLKLQTLLATVQASSGPLSTVSGDTSPFNKDASALSLSVGLGSFGTVLHTGLLLSHTDSASPSQVSSNATVHDLGISLVPVAPLLTLHADEVRSSAVIGGTCGSALSATGSTTLVNAGVGGTLGLGLQIGATVPPNTVLLNLLGIRVVLNEQILGGDGITSRTISVNAIHISVVNSLLAPLGSLSGDIVIAHSDAQVVCAPPPPPPTPKADLAVTLAAAPNPVTVGQTLTYTLNVSNAGPSVATGTVLSNSLPPGVTLVSAQPSQGSCSGTVVLSCSLGTLAVGGNASVVIQVIPNAAGSLTDTASVTSTVTDPNTANNSASVTVNAVAAPPMADLSLVLSAAPNPVTVGQTLTYTLNVSNAGPSVAAGTTLSDSLPAGVSFVSAQPSQGSCTGTTILSCSLGTLAVGGSASVVIQVIPNAAGSLTDTASVASTVIDPNPANNSASVTVNAVAAPPMADLSLALSAAPNPVTVGQTLTYTLNVSNAGPSTATGTVLSDSLPAGVTFVSVQPSQGGCSGTAPITCSLGSLAVGGNASIVIQVIPNAAGSLTDTASVTSSVADPNAGNNSASVTVDAIAAPQPMADLSLALSAAPNPVTVGQTLTYTLNVSNAGPSVATGTVLSDSLPPGVTFVSAQPSQGSCSGTVVLSCSLGTLAVGGNASVVIQVIPNAAGSLTDTASVTSTVTDPNTANNSASVTVNAVAAPPMADLSLALSAAPNPVTVGQTLTYTLNVSNAGPSVATGSVLSDSLPPGVTFVSALPSQGGCSGTAPITCSLGSLAVGGNASVVIQVIPNTPGSLTNTASVTSSVADPNAGNNSASVTVDAVAAQQPMADLSLVLSAAPNPVTVGQTLTYTLNVSNAGPSVATGSVLSDSLPAGVTFVSVQPSQGGCSGTAPITCSLGSLAVGGNASVVIQVIPNTPGSLTNTASVTSSVADPNAGNNSASVTVDAVAAQQPMADLSLALSAAPNPVTVGQTLTYTLNVSNAGPSVATGTVLSDSLPLGVTFVSAQPSQGSCSGSTALFCSLGTLAVGGNASVVIQVTPNAAGSLTDTASVSSSVGDPDTSNNSAAITVDAVGVPGEADLAISLGADPDPVETGQILTYFVDVANFGPSDAVSVVLSDVLPADVSLISIQPAQGSCTGTATISCALGTIASGNDVSVEIQVIPNNAGILIDSASTTSAVDDPDTSNNDATVAVTANGPSADLALTLTANPHPVLVGQTLTYTLTVTNGGPSDATGVMLSDGLPAGVTLVAVDPSQGSCSGTLTISCSLGTVAVGDSASVVIQVIPNQTGTLTDAASVTGSLGDPDPSNNSASVTVSVYTGNEPKADLSLTKQANAVQVSVGAQFTYQVTVTNGGPDDATGVVVTDPLPSGVTLISLSASQGDCTGTDTITCNLGALANGASAVVTLTVQAEITGILVNTATVTSTTQDLDDSNNSDTATVTVRQPE